MSVKISQTKDIRVSNRLKTLHHIALQETISRAEVSQQTGLNKATISTIVKEWIDLNIITETELGDSTGGRKPIMLNLIENAGYCIAIDMGVSKMQVILSNLNSKIIKKQVIPLVGTQFIENYNQLCRALTHMIDTLPPSPYGLIGIGVSVRGVVDLDGVIRNIPILKWRNIDIKTLLEERYHIPVYVDNDGNLAAIFEKKCHPEYRDIAVINITDVLSAGLIVNGEVLRGHHGFANAIGHHTINLTETKQCSCGKYGCLEQYCSNNAILNELNQSLDKPISRIEEFIALVKIQDETALKVLDHFTKSLATGLANIIFFLDCKVIILNSVVISSLPYLVADVLRNIVLPITQTQEILISDLGENSSILGALDGCIWSFFTQLANG